MNEDVFQKAVINDLNDLSRRINATCDVNDIIFSRIEKLEKDSKIVSDNIDEVISEHRAKIKSIEKQLEILHDFINDYIRKDSNRL